MRDKSFRNTIQFSYKYALLLKREVKMAEYWLRFFFFFLRFYGSRRSRGPQKRNNNKKQKNKNKNKKRTMPISSHLDRISLVNKGFIICPKDYTKISLLREQSGQSRAGNIGPSCPLGKPIRTQDSLFLPACATSHIIRSVTGHLSMQAFFPGQKSGKSS